MSNEEYIQTQSNIIILAGIVKGLNLDSFISRINEAESIAPITDPTLFKQAGANLSKIKALANALQYLKKEVKRQLDEAATA